MSGVWVVFEGGDGVGKTTQISLLADSLAGDGYDVVVTREPGGTDLGRELRAAVMHGDHVAPRAEALLYAADRAHHIYTVVGPALERGAVVLQDRYLDSSIVYQGGARALGDGVEEISLWATEGALPDLTVVLDMAPAADRMARDLDRVERETAEHAAAIRQGFLDLAARAPERYAVVDAARPVAEVFADVSDAVGAVLVPDAAVESSAAVPPMQGGIEPWGTP